MLTGDEQTVAETAAEHLARLGTDGAKWTDDFMARFEGQTLGSYGVEWGLMVTWFANAIESGRTAGQDWRNDAEDHIRADERAKVRAELLAIAYRIGDGSRTQKALMDAADQIAPEVAG